MLDVIPFLNCYDAVILYFMNSMLCIRFYIQSQCKQLPKIRFWVHIASWLKLRVLLCNFSLSFHMRPCLPGVSARESSPTSERPPSSPLLQIFAFSISATRPGQRGSSSHCFSLCSCSSKCHQAANWTILASSKDANSAFKVATVNHAMATATTFSSLLDYGQWRWSCES